MKYPKILSPFKRNDKKHFLPEFSSQEFRYLYTNKWFAYEKLDGMNCSVTWDGNEVSFSGKSDATEFTDEQMTYLTSAFKKEQFQVLEFEPFVLFGELVGPKANGNPYKLDRSKFILFDAFRFSTQTWQGVITLSTLSANFNISSARCLTIVTLQNAVQAFKTNQINPSYLNSFAFPGHHVEGFIFKPEVPLLMHNGNRVITKLKLKDSFTEGFDL